MEFTGIPIGRIVPKAAGVDRLPATIPPHTKLSFLIDRGTMTTAYPEVTVGGGKGSRLRLTYAEALVDSKGRKGNRNETENRTIVGLNDTFTTDGGADRTFSTLWWRAWRYLQVD